MRTPEVCVLMSTYNGEKYLQEQIDSILNQSYPAIIIKIRDDGSTDGTRAILKKYQSNERFTIEYGINKGAKDSFFDLMWNAPDADYYAFSDQDDVWLSDKIADAVDTLEKNSTAIRMYCTRKILVDDKLNHLGFDYDVNPVPSFGNALIESIASGCTEIFSSDLLAMIKNHKRPQHSIMHDWFIYQIASAYGKVYVGEKPKILYRLHSDNTVGVKKSKIAKIKRRLNDYRDLGTKVKSQARELGELYLLDEDKKSLIKDIYDPSYRRSMLKEKRIVRQNRMETFLYKLAVLFPKD